VAARTLVRPLSTILLTDGPPDPYLGIDISQFTTIPVDAKSAEIRADGILIGFGHKPFPGDFRTKGQLLAQRDVDGTDLIGGPVAWPSGVSENNGE
jgi:hypothetical protein